MGTKLLDVNQALGGGVPPGPFTCGVAIR